MRVVLNALPPARIDTPSAPLSILMAFLLHHGVATEVIYWNLLLDGLLPDFEKSTDATYLDLLPYLYLIAGKHGDPIAQAKANAYMKSQLPLRDILNDSSDYLAGVERVVDEAVAKEFARYSGEERLLFGMSCKYEQWIPGIVLAGYIKGYFPDSRIVLGGFRERDKARSIMKMCGDFDFAVWGEGEYPLLELCRALEAQEPGLSDIPRLIFRQGGAIRSSDGETGDFFDMNSGIFPDYDDYFVCRNISGKAGVPAVLPLESSRGCTWNACKFCVYSDGYKMRKKDAGVLREEVAHLLKKYGTPYFAFMDNDIVANDPGRLEEILDGLILLRQDHDAHFMAEVIHKDLTQIVMEKFPRAGFGRLHFGYESLSEGLLGKMRKKTNFSDNIFFVKFSRKFGIQLPSANVICGAVGEEDIDILECIDNLHFLRFYCDRDLFRHNIIPLRVANNSDFHRMLSREELARFDQDEVFHLLPDAIRQGVDRFALFDFSAPPSGLWEIFSKINDFYYDHAYSYSLSREGEHVIYTEFFDSQPVIRLEIGTLGYHILKETNSKVTGPEDLVRSCADGNAGIDEGYVFAALDFLKAKHLVYFDDAYRSIISVIDTGP
jgi:radical SAM superfamily enzyme YgiQ (UPF0313 family)